MFILARPNTAPVHPYTLAQLRADNPSTSFPLNPTAADLAPFHVAPVEAVEPPAHNPRVKRAVEQPPVLQSGKWKQVWTIRDATPAEIEEWDLSQPPDYQGFYNGLLVSSCYQAVLQQVMAAPTPGPGAALTVFVSAMQDCLAGRANVAAMQSAIDLILGQVTLTAAQRTELQDLLDGAYLGRLFTLPSPEPAPGGG